MSRTWLAAFSGLLGILALGILLYPLALDFTAHRVETSASSQWYSLKEIGITDIATTITEGISSLRGARDNEARALDLGYLADVGQLRITETTVLLNTESWEGGIESGNDHVGYPALVRNDAGQNPDGRYYLFYSIHDPYSGIAVAIADNPAGPFKKLRATEWWRSDSRILRAPRRPLKTSHFAAPVVIWNPQEQLWFMYFHYYVNDWETGQGHQKTALATTGDLSSHAWTIWKDDEGRIISALPVTSERWMNSQSSYHSIHRLPSGLWIAFLRGVGGEYESSTGAWRQDVAKLGFAISRDGRRWAKIEGNPVIHHGDGTSGREGVYRPLFLARYGDDLLLAWSESAYYDSDAQPRFGLTRDLATVRRIPAPLPAWSLADGPASLWLEDQLLYIYQGGTLALAQPLNPAAKSLN